MEEAIRSSLKSLLTTSHAHMSLTDAVKDFPTEHINDLPPHIDYSPWMLLEHIRFAQKDILNYLGKDTYVEPEWPKDYWPAKGTKATEEMWQKTLADYQSDLAELTKLVDSNTDLLAKAHEGSQATVLKELFLVIDHTSYHLGEFAILRDVMATWPADHKK